MISRSLCPIPPLWIGAFQGGLGPPFLLAAWVALTPPITPSSGCLAWPDCGWSGLALRGLQSLPKDPRQWGLAALVLASSVGIGHWLVTHWGIEETDNAQLQAHLVELSSRVPGTITALPVQDNQVVQQGQ